LFVTTKPVKSPGSRPSTTTTPNPACSQPPATPGRSSSMDLVVSAAFLPAVLARRRPRMLPTPPPCGGSGRVSRSTSPTPTSTLPPWLRRRDDKNGIVATPFYVQLSRLTSVRCRSLHLLSTIPRIFVARFPSSCPTCLTARRNGFPWKETHHSPPTRHSN